MRMYYCSWQDCKVELNARGYCNKHQPLIESREKKRKQRRDDYFRNARRANQGYYHTKQWRLLRAEVLKKQSSCITCGSSEQLHIDHIKPPRGNKDLFFNENNLQVLCHACHRLKTAEEIRIRKQKTKDNVGNWLKDYVLKKD